MFGARFGGQCPTISLISTACHCKPSSASLRCPILLPCLKRSCVEPNVPVLAQREPQLHHAADGDAGQRFMLHQRKGVLDASADTGPVWPAICHSRKMGWELA